MRSQTVRVGVRGVIAASSCWLGTEWVRACLNCLGSVVLVTVSGCEFQYFIILGK